MMGGQLKSQVVKTDSGSAPEDSSFHLTTTESARRFGWCLTIVFVVVFGLWSTAFKIDSVVTAPGTVDLARGLTSLEHPRGGTIVTVSGRNGLRVAEGAVLVTFDTGELERELDGLIQRERELTARLRRLTAQADVSREFAARRYDSGPTILRVAMVDEEILKAYRAERDGAIRVRLEQHRQMQASADGLNAQLTALYEELALLEALIAEQDGLRFKGPRTKRRLLEYQRDRAALLGQIGQTEASIEDNFAMQAELEAEGRRIADQEVVRLGAERRQIEVDLDAVRRRITEIRLEIALAIIRAPRAGVLHNFVDVARGSVVGPGEKLGELVPNDGRIGFSVMVPPSAIEQIYVGQRTWIQMTSTGAVLGDDLEGIVASVSPDTTETPNGESFAVFVKLAPGTDLGVGFGVGTPVTAHFELEKRRPINYLFGPALRFFGNALNEE